MGDLGRDDQDYHRQREHPTRPDDQLVRYRKIKTRNGQHGNQSRPTRFGIVNVGVWFVEFRHRGRAFKPQADENIAFSGLRG